MHQGGLRWGEFMTLVIAGIIGFIVTYLLYSQGYSHLVSLGGGAICAAIYATWRTFRGHK